MKFNDRFGVAVVKSFQVQLNHRPGETSCFAIVNAVHDDGRERQFYASSSMASESPTNNQMLNLIQDVHADIQAQVGAWV